MSTYFFDKYFLISTYSFALKECNLRCAPCWPPARPQDLFVLSGFLATPEAGESLMEHSLWPVSCFLYSPHQDSVSTALAWVPSAWWAWPQAGNSPHPSSHLSGRLRSQMLERELGRDSPKHMGTERPRQGVTCFWPPASPCWTSPPCHLLDASCLLALYSLSLTGTHLSGPSALVVNRGDCGARL